MRFAVVSLDLSTVLWQGMGCFVLLGWLWGVNLYIWSAFRINYIYIFELDPRFHMSHKHVFEQCTSVTIVFFVNFLLYYKVCSTVFSQL
jgi:hypothetical protein